MLLVKSNIRFGKWKTKTRVVVSEQEDQSPRGFIGNVEVRLRLVEKTLLVFAWKSEFHRV